MRMRMASEEEGEEDPNNGADFISMEGEKEARRPPLRSVQPALFSGVWRRRFSREINTTLHAALSIPTLALFSHANAG